MDDDLWNLGFDLGDLLGRTLVALHQTPWFAPCHRPTGAVVGADDFTCRPILELDDGRLVELGPAGLWPFDPAEPHDGVDFGEHRLETLRPVLSATLRAILLARDSTAGRMRPLAVLDNGVTLGLDGPPGKRLWIRDLEDFVVPRGPGSTDDGHDGDGGKDPDFFDRPTVWTDVRTGEAVDLRDLLPLRTAMGGAH